jgi:16S rRNA (cytosine967-C5)-methyltransferase
VSPARLAAFRVLTLVGAGKGNSDDLMHGALTAGLSAEDRGLATALVMGVLRWQIALDATVQGFLSRPDQRLGEPVAIALRMGAFQAQHMDRIPAHAAVNESVELCRVAGEPQAAGMVNAILRKVLALKPRGAPLVEPAEAMAKRLGHPAWLVTRWAAAYGLSAARRICEYDQEETAGGGLFREDAAEGMPRIDDGSRLVAEIAAAAAPEVSGRALRVWDACAAPGGKTQVLAARLAEAEILATDVSATRLARMKLRLGEGSGRVRFEVGDAAVVDAARGEFDLILCDMPCSGTGTLARNPEIRLRLKPEELARQAARQRAILEAGLRSLAPGGRLVYSTCSLEPEENERVVQGVALPAGCRVAQVRPILEALAAGGRLSEGGAAALLPGAVRGNWLRTLPGIQPCDGFFATIFERR